MGLTCSNEPVPGTGQAAPPGCIHAVGLCSCRRRGLCAATCREWSLSHASIELCWRVFWRRANLSQTKAMLVVLVAFKQYRLSHSSVQTYFLALVLRYYSEFTCNELQGKGEAGGERPPLRPPVLGIPGVNSSLSLSLGLAAHHTLS